MVRRAVAISGLLLFAAAPSHAATMEPGAYRVTYRLEVPHVEQFAIDMVTTLCAREPLPRVLSGNNPLAHCPARNIRRQGDDLSFDIVCPGRRNDSARAAAVFTLKPGRLEGRIHMVMGGKNMTFVEVQSWRRIGACDRLARH
jgi:hypothetical protein